MCFHKLLLVGKKYLVFFSEMSFLYAFDNELKKTFS